jgi:hypothetical protein
MEDWRFDGVIYRRLQDPYINRIVKTGRGNSFNQYLYAPDVVKIEERYYLYYGVALTGSGIGVAVAEKPEGPYSYAGRVRFPEEAKPGDWKDMDDGIEDGDMAFGMGVPMLQPNPLKKNFGLHFKDYPYDPAVLYDDGRLYLYYGSGYCQVVELDIEDKRTVLKNPRTGKYGSERLLPASGEKSDRQRIAEQGGWHMANGSSIRKINGLYYLSYYAVNKRNRHALCYSTSTSPWGPFQYRGVLISLGNGGYRGQSAPTAYGGNTHGGIVEAKGRWFVNYHRQTGDPSPARQACMAELVKNPDGTFQQAEFQSQVQAEGGLPCQREWPAYMACVLTDSRGRTRKNSGSPYLAVKEHEKGLRLSGILPNGAVPESGETPKYQFVTGLSQGCVVGFKYLDFPLAAQEEIAVFITLRNALPGRVDMYFDGLLPENRRVSILISPQKDEETYGAVFPADPGKHGIYFHFYGQKKHTDFISFTFKAV